ncbi:c-type cytochrome [Roseovarius salinarum]|uniref:c-type cytochrome n=1 Tax=Roseovarius salinarum TaxID=1981892 RepID=UPI000C33F9A4|nr:c-type cytochrome [Roseovarius salinarum]
MTLRIATAIAATAVALPAFAETQASGDAAAGETAFNMCRACHKIVDDEGNAIVNGGPVGPNLYGVTERGAGGVEDFAYSDVMMAAGEAGLEWTEETFVAYVQAPTKYLQEQSGESGRGKMTYKVRSEEDAKDLWAYLVSVDSGGDS